jgi:hypothetical protein
VLGCSSCEPPRVASRVLRAACCEVFAACRWRVVLRGPLTSGAGGPACGVLHAVWWPIMIGGRWWAQQGMLPGWSHHWGVACQWPVGVAPLGCCLGVAIAGGLPLLAVPMFTKVDGTSAPYCMGTHTSCTQGTGNRALQQRPVPPSMIVVLALLSGRPDPGPGPIHSETSGGGPAAPACPRHPAPGPAGRQPPH